MGHKTMITLALAASAATGLAAPVWDDPGAPKKLIALGWDTGDRAVEELVPHAADFVAAGYDGIAVSMKYPAFRDGKGGKLLGWSSPVYDEKDFVSEDKLLSRVEPMKALNRTGLTHNFVSMSLFFGKWRSYSDEAFWRNACRKAALFAKIAKESGSAGVLIDTEDYPHLGQFYYIPKNTSLSYREEARFARQRGRAFMQALMSEYPDMDILTTWLISNQSRKSYQDTYSGPLAAAERNGDLFVPFMQGLVEGLDPRATLVDGDEAGYWCEAARREFCYDYVAIRQLGLGLMPPDLRGKYNDQVRAAFGLYLDSYTLPPKNGWSKGEIDGSRLKRYELNLKQAFETSDKYVWIWGEHYSFAEWKNTLCKGNVYPTWESALPGVGLMQRFAKDPKGTGEALWRAKAASGEPLENLIRIDGTETSVSNRSFVGTTAKGFAPTLGRARTDGFTPAWTYVKDGHDGRPGMRQSGTFGASVAFPGLSDLGKKYGAIYRASVWFKTSPEVKYAIDPTLSFGKTTQGHPIWNDGGGWHSTPFKQPSGHSAQVVAGPPDKDGWREAVVYFRADACDRTVSFSAGLGRRLWEDEWVIVSDPQVVMIAPPSPAPVEAEKE